MKITLIKKKCKYAACVLACLMLLLAAGCADAPVDESQAESSATVSQPVSAAESSVAESEASIESSEQSVVELSSEDSEETSSIKESSEETSAEPVRRPIYRDEEEPSIEQIVLPTIGEKGFALTQTYIKTEIGERFAIPYEFTPLGTTQRKLTWTSSNTRVVTVSPDGTLTAVGKGISYIRATTSTGRYSECKVEVVDELPYSALAKRIKAVANGAFGGLRFALCDLDLDGVQELIVHTTVADGLPRVDIYEIEVAPESSDETGEEVSEEVSDEISDETSDESSEESEEPKPEGWVAGFDTGDDEEWAVWEREDGTRFWLISFSQKAENGDVRHVMVELTLVMPDLPPEDEFDESDESDVSDETSEELEPKETMPTLQCVYVLTREVIDGESTYYALQDGVFDVCDQETYQAIRTAYFAANKQQDDYHLTWASGTEPKEIETLLQELVFEKSNDFNS